MKDEELFREARLKIKRAKEHVNDLNRLFAEFSRRKTHEVFVEYDPDAGCDFLKVRATETLGDDFVLILGDALHNLRTSLDFAMNEIEFRTIGERTPYTKFPASYTSRNSLINAVNGGLKEKAPKEVIDCIVDIVQPYKGGRGHAIWGLHEIDIEDKHRLLIANTELQFIRGICIEDDAGMEHAIGDWLVVPGKVASYPITGNRNVKVKDEGNVTYTVSFGHGMPFSGYGVIKVTRALVEEVESVLKEIEYWFRLSMVHRMT